MHTVINIKDLHRHYKMGDTTVKAVNGIDLKINRGDFMMIVGSSGSGKSTLMHILGLLDKPTSGRYEINDANMAESNDDEMSHLRNRHIGFIFQQFNLLGSLPIVENVALPLSYRGIILNERIDRAKEQLEAIGLGDRLHHTPGELSGGQMQRVAISRALVSKPDIILADEPTGNLDSKTSEEIMNILYDLHASGHTIIMVTHDTELANEGTRKVTFRDGKIIGDEKGKRSISSQVKTPQKNKQEFQAGLSIKELLRIGIREGLMAHKMRSFLTMLGILIGVSSVIAMSSFSLGSKKKQADQIRALGSNLVRIIDKNFENERLTQARTDGSNGLSLSDFEHLRSNLPEIEKASLMREIKMNVVHESGTIDTRILGVKGDYLGVNNLRLHTGRFFDHHDLSSNSAVIIIGYPIAKKIGIDSAIGSKLILGGTPYQIIGVLRNKNIDTEELEASTIADPNNAILIPLDTLISRTTNLALRNQIDEIQLQLFNEDHLFKIGASIKRILNVTHSGVDDFELVIPMELLKQKQQSQKLLDVLTFCISTISIIVGGIGIMNIMLASVTERIKEIGIRRAIGATQKDILYQFLSESVLISASGGVIGIILAILSVILICSVTNIPVVFSYTLLIVAVLTSTIVGIAFGIYPAYQAAKKNPVEALRNE